MSREQNGSVMRLQRSRL